jgi:hypothetical protein
VSSALAGLDMAMPGDGAIPLLGDSFWNFELSTAILNGSVPLERLNDMVRQYRPIDRNEQQLTIRFLGHTNRSNMVSNGPR